MLTRSVPDWFTNRDSWLAASFPGGATPRWSEKFDVVFGHSTKVAFDSVLCSLRFSGLLKPHGSFAKLVYWSRLLLSGKYVCGWFVVLNKLCRRNT